MIDRWPRWFLFHTCLAISLVTPRAALAGMPSFTVSDVPRMRFEAISFFIVAFLVCAGLVQLAWNTLRKDFVRLPKLTYGKAMTMLGLWGLLFVLVLTMISGARELMTPGAWKKDGLTYKLSKSNGMSDVERELWQQIESDRWSRLAELKAALWAYAKSHDGQLPLDMSSSSIADELWQTPEPSRMRYLYVGSRSTGKGADLIACEPPIFPLPRLALTSDGRIQQMDETRIVEALNGGTSR